MFGRVPKPNIDIYPRCAINVNQGVLHQLGPMGDELHEAARLAVCRGVLAGRETAEACEDG